MIAEPSAAERGTAIALEINAEESVRERTGEGGRVRPVTTSQGRVGGRACLGSRRELEPGRINVTPNLSSERWLL